VNTSQEMLAEKDNALVDKDLREQQSHEIILRIRKDLEKNSH
jgi:hypothetical protein